MIANLLAGHRAIVLAALLTAGVAGSASWQVRGWSDASSIAAARTDQARAERNFSDLSAAVANNRAELERARAEQEAKTRRAVESQSQKIIEVQTRLTASERKRLALSTELRKELSHAPIGDVRDLGPAALRYLERVRAEQGRP